MNQYIPYEMSKQSSRRYLFLGMALGWTVTLLAVACIAGFVGLDPSWCGL